MFITLIKLDKKGEKISDVNKTSLAMIRIDQLTYNYRNKLLMQNEQNHNHDKLISSKTANIATIIRVRPLLPSEQEASQCIQCKDEKTLQINTIGSKRLEVVDCLFNTQTTQRQLFNYVEPFLSKVIDGYNVTILTYGQTGSGKTHTMFGSDWNNIIKSTQQQAQKQGQSTFLRSIEQDENHSGLIPRCINLLFDKIITKRRKFIKVYCSFLQLYNENMLDLFQSDEKEAKDQKLVIHENKQDGIYVEGLNEIVIENVDQCLQLMKKGQKNRIVRHTHMNIKSSRSHTLFQLLIEQVFPKKKSFRRMKINLCDLAGSEKIIKSQKIEDQHFQQLKNINLSLTTLGKVISALAGKDSSIPYRQSKLTRLLQDSLGGNTYTAIIATISTKSSCLEQSINTLKFLQRAKQVKTQIVTKTFSENPAMRNLQKQINYLKDMLKLKRTGAIVDIDINQRYKRLQQQNQKLKALIDEEIVERLKKQNITLKRELQKKNNDHLSDSYLQSKPSINYKTIDHQSNKYQVQDTKSDVIKQGKTSPLPIFQAKRYDSKSYSGKNEDGISTNKDTSYKRNTGVSVFPILQKKNYGKNSNKILDRILEIERVKQQNKLKLQRQLQLMEQRASYEAGVGKGTKYSVKYQ